jgi:hypothetical protein
MFTEEQILKIVSDKIEVFKSASVKKELPEYTPVYRESVDYYERVSVHSEIGKFPQRIFKKRSPNQSQEEFDYMEANYKTTTFPIWARFTGVLNRIWNDQNWSVKYPDNYEEIENYLTNYPVYGSLENYFKSIVTPLKEKDSNAVIAHKPFKIPTKQRGEDIVVDETQRLIPHAVIYNSPQIIGFEDEVYALIELQEKSLVNYGGGLEKSGKVFEFYDDQNIWIVKQVGKKIDYKFEIYLLWNHELGFLPVKKLKGIPIQKEGDVLYQSHFMSAIEPMDLILLDSSHLQASKAGHAFPHKWEYTDECDYNGEYGQCVDGYVVNQGKTMHCPSCSGTGRKKKGTVLGVTQVKTPTSTNPENGNMTIPPLGWVAPDPTILEFLRGEIEKNGKLALSILNLDSSDSDVKGSDTALGKQIDREELFSFIQGISNELFELYEFSNKCLIQMAFPENKELPEISCPKNFSIRSEADLTLEISEANKNGMPDSAKSRLLLEWFSKRFNSIESAKIDKIVFATDRLFALTPLEINAQKLSGVVANWEVILHTSINNFIVNISIQDVNFLDKDIEEQKRLLVEMAKAKETEIAPKRINADQILANL